MKYLKLFENIEFDEWEDGLDIDEEIKVGETFEYSVDDVSASTGFQWVAKLENDNVRIKSHVELDNFVGGTNKQIFIIRGIKPGVCLVTIELKRQWENKKPHKVETINIKVI